MDLFPLTIFPEGALAGSIITTVWVGVFVMCYFNLRFGWVLSGLVVPGYLVPLLIVKPFAAMVISVEAILSYLIVWLFSEKLAPGRFPSLFGRDRFMGLILASIVVRLSFDGFLLPEFGAWMEDNFDRRIDWENNLQSFGLVIISLMANQFWKPGLAKGLFTAFVTIGLTYLIIRYGLMEATNFRISGVYYMYEGLASSILASPKAYIILTLTALIASHYNVRYGWDFSGILIPALIALQWYQPTKIITSVGEAIIIYCLARLILKLPFMANITMEGGRKMLLFFNISFAWKMALGWFVIWQGLEIKTADFFGFGYLLSTLIAIKAHDKDIFPRVVRSTLQVSLAGAVLGNIGGFALSAATARTGWNADGQTLAMQDAQSAPRLNGYIVNAVGDAYIRSQSGTAAPLSAKGEETLEQLVELIDQGIPQVAAQFERAADEWRILRIVDGRLAIVRDDRQGAELLIYDPAALRDQAIIVPDPTVSPGLAIAALQIQRSQDARWLVFSVPHSGPAVANRTVAEIFEQSTETSHVAIGIAQSGEPSTFTFANNGVTDINMAELRKQIPDLEVALASENLGMRGKDARLALSTEALRTVSESKIDRRLGSGADNCRLYPTSDDVDTWNTLPQLAFTRFEIAEPMIDDARNGRVPLTAMTSASLAGMVIGRCKIGKRAHWHLASPNRNEGNILVAENAQPQKAILTFQNDRSTLPARMGSAIHATWGSDALFVATRSDSFLRDPRTVFDVTWQAWVRSQEGVEDPMIFQLRARPREAMQYRRGVDVLIAKDHVGTDNRVFGELISSLYQAGLRLDTVENSRQQAGMEARPGMSLRYLDATSGRRHAYGWVMSSGIGRIAE